MSSLNQTDNNTQEDQDKLEVQRAYEIICEVAKGELEWFTSLIETLKELERQYLEAKAQLLTPGARNALEHRYYATLWNYQKAVPATPLVAKLLGSFDIEDNIFPPKPPYYFIHRDKRAWRDWRSWQRDRLIEQGLAEPEDPE